MLNVIILSVNMLIVVALTKPLTKNLGSCLILWSQTLTGTNVIELFAAIIYCHSTVIPSFCVIYSNEGIITVECQ
jgi:hypothetical protein